MRRTKEHIQGRLTYKMKDICGVCVHLDYSEDLYLRCDCTDSMYCGARIRSIPKGDCLYFEALSSIRKIPVFKFPTKKVRYEEPQKYVNATVQQKTRTG